MLRRLALSVVLAGGFMSGSALGIEPDAPERLLTTEDLVKSVLRDVVARMKPTASPRDRQERAAISAFYEGRDWRPAWVDAKGLNDKGRAIVEEIKAADDWGLVASTFELPNLAGAGAALGNQVIAAEDLRLTVAILKYAREARGGRTDPSVQLSKNLDRTPALFEPRSVLDETATSEDPSAYLRRLHPQHPQFERLRKAYVALKAKGHVAIEKIPDGPRIAPGTSHPHVAIVRRRLGLASLGDDGRDMFLDEAVARALREFQSARGITPASSAIDLATRRAFNAVEGGSPKRLLANMEQWRWMPDDLGAFHVWVSIPDFTVRVMKDGQVIWSERIIVGKVDTQTPIFSDEMEFVVFHPEWGVPDSIKVKELWPSLRHSTSILAKQNLRVMHNGRVIDPDSVDWAGVDPRTFSFIQTSGNGNVLGVVKFRFPNKHDVYMHDTPTKGLFSSAVRAYSHGCMRVQNPVRLAEIVLAHDKQMAAERV
ncbi:MAG TPA: L,D-transpeptidase family protein, partial [Hyphomicrobiaceae bacterium]|nr:L,D-transpeptidase family protein [Hyphomicrobiaceae bacterium]